jgi:(3,5-dihydroxyphenyl)acetyl-CoA 1,2-dioxygenase
MIQMHFPEALQTWLQNGPEFGVAPEADAQRMSEYLQCGERLLGEVPDKPSRSEQDAQYAASIHTASRKVRQRFLASNIDRIYSVVTHGGTRHRSLGELAFEAAECYPGLVPTRAQIAEERTRPQAEKEGLEIDQGLFFQALLRSPLIASQIMKSVRMPTPRAVALVRQFQREGSLDLGSVLIERRGCAAHLTVNNGSCLNAEDDRLIDDMETAVDLALLDEAVHVGVIRGGIMSHPRYAGRRVFSAGINLKALHHGDISFVDFLLRRELGYINKLLRGIVLPDDATCLSNNSIDPASIEKPWIAAVDSFAIGGGAQLLLVFDHVIAAVDSYVSLPAAQEGIVPGFANLRLSRAVGPRVARQMILGGRKILASEPDARLLLDQIVDTSEIEAAIDEQVDRLSAPAVIANRHMLHVSEEPPELFLRYAAEFALVQAERLYSPDVLDKVRRASTKSAS